jgi:hypothetical protein
MRNFVVWIDDEARKLVEIALDLPNVPAEHLQNGLDMLQAAEELEGHPGFRKHREQVERSLAKLRRRFPEAEPAMLGYTLGNMEAMLTSRAACSRVGRSIASELLDRVQSRMREALDDPGHRDEPEPEPQQPEPPGDERGRLVWSSEWAKNDHGGLVEAVQALYPDGQKALEAIAALFAAFLGASSSDTAGYWLGRVERGAADLRALERSETEGGAGGGG